jgi:hypothetical protein
VTTWAAEAHESSHCERLRSSESHMPNAAALAAAYADSSNHEVGSSLLLAQHADEPPASVGSDVHHPGSVCLKSTGSTTETNPADPHGRSSPWPSIPTVAVMHSRQSSSSSDHGIPGIVWRLRTNPQGTPRRSRSCICRRTLRAPASAWVSIQAVPG